MAVSDVTTLKNSFINNKVPTSADFSDLIDTGFSNTWAVRTLASLADTGTGLVIVTSASTMCLQEVTGFGVNLLELSTTADADSKITSWIPTFVSAGYNIEATIGLSGNPFSGTLTIQDDVSAGWYSGNRITSDVAGRIKDLNWNRGDIIKITEVSVTSTTTHWFSDVEFTSANRVRIIGSSLRSSTPAFLRLILTNDTSAYRVNYIFSNTAIKPNPFTYGTNNSYIQIMTTGAFVSIASVFINVYPIPSVMVADVDYHTTLGTYSQTTGFGTRRLVGTTIRGIGVEVSDGTFTAGRFIAIYEK